MEHRAFVIVCNGHLTIAAYIDVTFHWQAHEAGLDYDVNLECLADVDSSDEGYTNSASEHLRQPSSTVLQKGGFIEAQANGCLKAFRQGKLTYLADTIGSVGLMAGA